MKIIRWAFGAIGFFVAIRFFYWAACELGYGLGWSDAPAVSHDWLFFAFLNAGIYMVWWSVGRYSNA